MDLAKQGEDPKQDVDQVDNLGSENIDPDRLIERVDGNAAHRPSAEDFDPDRLISPEDAFDGDDVKPSGEVDEAELYSAKQDRLDIACRSKGEWSGEKGNSEFTPANDEARETIKEFDRETVGYKDGVVDFSPFAKETVSIENMTSDIVTNRTEAYRALSKKWNAEAKDGRTDWSSRDVADWKSENNLEFHECSDLKTCQFVPAEIHQACKHAGGRYEARCREAMNAEGGFDE